MFLSPDPISELRGLQKCTANQVIQDRGHVIELPDGK
jgi:hypothetical protein